MSAGTSPTLNVTVKENIVEPTDDFKNPFRDLSQGRWYYSDVAWAYVNGLFTGTSSTEFNPDMSMNRAMIVTVLGRLHNVDADFETQSQFDDVAKGEWYTPYVEWARTNGLVTGTSAKSFSPNDQITRQDLATLLMRYAKFVGKDILSDSSSKFTDDNKISDYAKEAVSALKSAGIINGKSNNMFDPRAFATRAEVAAIFHRYVRGIS